MHRKMALLSVLALVGALLALAPAAQASGTIVVKPSSLDGWAFNTTDDTGAVPSLYGAGGGFVAGPATPPLGTGSAHLFTGTDGGESAQFRNTGYDGVPLASLTELVYSTYMTTSNGQQMPYLSLEISTDGSGTLDDRIFFEPPYQEPSTGNPSLPDQGASVLNTWQDWDALVGGWWANSGGGFPTTGCTPGTGVCSLADYLAQYPAATIENKVDGLGGIRLAVGFASAGDDFDGNVDGFAIGVSGDTPPTTSSQSRSAHPCATWMTRGNNANGGASIADAKKTIQAAINQVSAGGQVRVLPGTYDESAPGSTPTSCGAGRTSSACSSAPRSPGSRSWE